MPSKTGQSTEPYPQMQVIFSVDLSDAIPGEEYWVQACGQQYSLTRHTAETRAAARAANPRLAKIPDDQLTHFTNVPVFVPFTRSVRLHVKHTMKTVPGAKAKYGVGNVFINVPPAEITPGAPPPQELINYYSTAQALLFHHSDLINAEQESSSAIYEHMEELNDEFNAVATLLREQGPPTETSGWALLTPVTPGYKGGHKGLEENDTYYHVVPSDVSMGLLGPTSARLLTLTKNDTRLRNK